MCKCDEHETKWIDIKDKQPEKGKYIIYSSGVDMQTCIGKYCGVECPMPSAPDWLPWEDVEFWMPLPELPKKTEADNRIR